MLKRNIFDDEDAVSEVVGTILILSITVVLFSTIFATVSHLETPDSRTHTEMEAEFIIEDEKRTISISHQGGKSIDMYDTTFFVVIDGNSRSYNYNDDELQLIDGDDDVWEIGEIVEIDITNQTNDLDGLEDHIAEILVSDNINNQLIWRTELSLRAIVEVPRIRDIGVYYRPEWKNYVEKGDNVTLYAKVSHPTLTTGELDVSIDLEGLENYGGFEDMDYYGVGYEFRKEISIASNEIERTYQFEVRADDGNTFSKAYLNLNVGPRSDVRERPNILVDENKINFNPSSPTSGESLRVDAVIENDGGSRATVNVTVWDRRPNGDEVQAGVIENLRIAAGGGRDISATWNVRGSGEHNITIDVTEVESPGGENYRDIDDVEASREVYVKPSILVVDDDPTGVRETSLIKSALSGADFSFDEYQVGGPEADGPSAGTLDRYDLTIWLTGRATENTLTNEDIDNLEEYLDNGNYLWLIGEGVMSEIGETYGDFVDEYLGIQEVEVNQGAPNHEYVNGTGILENITSPVNDNFDFDGDHIEPNLEANPMMIDGLDEDVYVGTSYNNSEVGYRVAVNSIQMQSIRSGHSTIAYRVIKWLANMDQTSGRDIAVSEQSFSTRTPMYQEDVDVSATIRNNGPFEETVDVRLYINDRLDTTQRMQVTLEPDGGSKDVTFEWSAQPVGSHDLVIKADPFNRIDETNVLNNDITYTDFDTTINVQYSVLLVDATYNEDDLNTTQFAQSHIESLGYAYDYFKIETGEERPDSELMSNYNSIKWIVGNATFVEGNGQDPQYPLSEDDIEQIQSYLDENSFVSFYLEGHRILEDLRGFEEGRLFIENYLGIENSPLDLLEETPSELHGVTGDEFTHGMNYLIDSYGGISDFYGFSLNGALPVFTDENGNTVGARYENEEDEYKTVFSGVGLAHISGPNVEEEWYEDFVGPVNTSADSAREEYVYMLTKWFGNEDERIELRVADVDISIDNDRPTLGKSYLLAATIQNVGFRDSSALIRFKDGDSLIASESIHVSGDSFHTAEVSWRPTFAGKNRPIRVLVDPLQNVHEIGNDPEDPETHDTMGFNNHAVLYKQVYYFWDDMEDGDGNWNHEATIANINAEQPLEYLSEEYENVYTDVVSEWDDEMSHEVTVTDQFSHSDPNSYWMAEPMAVNETKRLPMDMGLMIDTTGSMNAEADDGRTWMEHAIEATKDLIDMFDEDDRVALFNLDHHHKDAGSFLWEDFRYMTEDNKDYFKSRVDEFEADGGTPLWDASGYTINHLVENPRDSGTPGEDYVQSTMLFTDGVDEHYSWGKLEGGSNQYAPGSLTGDGPEDHTWGVEDGHLWGQGEYEYENQDGSGSDVQRYYHESRAGFDGGEVHWQELEFRESSRSTERLSLMKNPTLTFTVALGVEPSAYLDPGDSGYMDPGASEYPFTSEYQLIQIAESTEGSYFYAPDADELGDIFEEVFEQAAEEAEEGEVTSVPPPDSDRTETISSENGLDSGHGLMQTELLPTESFEGSFPPSGWAVYKEGHVQSNEWEQTSARANTGSYSVWHENEGNRDADGWLVTPQIDATSFTSVILEYYDYTAWAGSYDYHGIYVSTGSGDPNQGDFVEIQEMDDVTNSWQQRTVDLSTYDESTFYLAFRYEQWSNWADDWYIDDVTIYGESDVGGPLPPTNPIPNDGASGVATDVELSVYVEHDDGDPMDVSFYDGSGSLIGTDNNVASGSQASVTWSGLDYETTYEWYAVADDGSLTATSSTWSFTTHAEDEDPVDPDPGLPTGENENKTAVTPAFDLSGYDTARLSFMQKYRMVSGSNGGFVMIGWEEDGELVWRYVDRPSQRMYNGNLDLDVHREDDFGNEIVYAYNGVSGGGTFGWEQVRINIMNYVPDEYRDSVRIKFNYTQYGSGTGYGWYLDDVRVTVSREGELDNDNSADMWHLTETTGYDGEDTTAWRNMDLNTGELKGGIDNSLITTSIDLTNARTAYLSAYFKFNINEQSGVPPDGFRVEITTDGGVTWMPLNVGVRTAYGVSGSGPVNDESNSGANVGHNWTTADSLSRLETDLSDFSGNVVSLRFRVVTTNAENYDHVEDPNTDGGFYVDEVVISGSSTAGD